MKFTPNPKPFLKWAGGKRWLISREVDPFPSKFNKYFEPFLGGGAVFFGLQPSQASLGDINRDLIETYLGIRDNWKTVLAHLKRHQESHSSEHYYSVRARIPNGRYAKAARFIYLNRTCWNGLYRVNLKGKFNVPIGSKDTVLLPGDDFEAISQALQDVELRCCDFEQIVDQAEENDFVYIDPPYTVNHAHNGFIKYNEVLFSWEDQKRLRDAALRAINRGAKVLVSNAHHQTITELYGEPFELKTLTRQSVISGKASGRGEGLELLISGGYE